MKDITAEEGIMAFAEQVGAGIIALSTHGRSGLAHFFSGSLAENMVNHSKKIVLTRCLNR
jgi:nucleotide-binding universal stress UspA family protein